MKQTYKLILIEMVLLGLCASGAQAQLKTTTPIIKLRAGGSFPDGCTAVLNIAGCYEV